MTMDDFKVLQKTDGYIIKCSKNFIHKIFQKSEDTPELLAKLRYLEQHCDQLKPVAIVPVECDASPLQYKAEYNNGIQLNHALFIDSLRDKYFESIDRSDLVKICLNLINCIEVLSSCEIKLLGLNYADILIDSKYQVIIANLEENYVNGINPTEYRSNTHLSRYGFTFDASDDVYRFDICIVLFMILMLGRHPFYNTMKSKTLENMRAYRFDYVFGDTNLGSTKDNKWTRIWKTFPFDLRKMFHDTFSCTGVYSLDDIKAILTKYETSVQEQQESKELFPDVQSRKAPRGGFTSDLNPDAPEGGTANMATGINIMENGDINKAAVFELSTRAVKVLVGHHDQLKDGFTFEAFKTVSELTHTGKGHNQDNVLDLNYFKSRVLPMIKILYAQLNKHNVHKVAAVATAAYRSARNIDEILSLVKQATDLDVKVLGKKEEAMMTFVAFKHSGESKLQELGDTVLIIDQGGGSTELTLEETKDGKILDSRSLNYGTTVLQSILISDYNNLAPLSESFANIELNINNKMADYYQQLGFEVRNVSCISVGSAITSATNKRSNREQHLTELTYEMIKAKIDSVHDKLVRKFSNVAEMITYTHMNDKNEKEVTSLLVVRLGLPMYLNLMTKFGIEKIIVSGTALRYGVFYSLCRP